MMPTSSNFKFGWRGDGSASAPYLRGLGAGRREGCGQGGRVAAAAMDQEQMRPALEDDTGGDGPQPSGARMRSAVSKNGSRNKKRCYRRGRGQANLTCDSPDRLPYNKRLYSYART